MRLILASFRSADEFLRSYSSAHDGGALFYATRMELDAGEQVLVEIAFPELPNRTILRGQVAGTHGAGVWVEFSRESAQVRDYVLTVARGETPATAFARKQQRFPIALPCNWQIPGSADQVISFTDDLGAGGAFVRTRQPPPVGTALQITVGPVGEGADQPMTLHGHVTWVRASGDAGGMGVRFNEPQEIGNRRLREVLRHVTERGRVELRD